MKTAVEGGLRRVPDELKKLQAANYGSISSRSPSLFSQEDDDLSIDAELEAASAAPEKVVARMTVVKRAKLRAGSARDSATCGHLSVGTVVDVLEKIVLGKELLLDDSVRCAHKHAPTTDHSLILRDVSERLRFGSRMMELMLLMTTE